MNKQQGVNQEDGSTIDVSLGRTKACPLPLLWTSLPLEPQIGEMLDPARGDDQTVNPWRIENESEAPLRPCSPFSLSLVRLNSSIAAKDNSFE